MAPSERAKQVRREADLGVAAAQTQLGKWYFVGSEGLERDEEKAAALYLLAADRGDTAAQSALAGCYMTGVGVQQSWELGAEWVRKAADLGDSGAQFDIGKMLELGWGVTQDLPLAKEYLELCAAQGKARGMSEEAVFRLKGPRFYQCASCGTLDVHMICSRCRSVRYCDTTCQRRHWSRPADPHKLHCVLRRREAAGEGGSGGSGDGDMGCKQQ